MLMLAKGSLCPHALPWWSRPPLRPPLRVSAPESQGTQGGLLGGCRAPPGLLLPCTAGPCIRLWHRCYLRALPQEQVLGKLGTAEAGTGLGGLGLGGPSLSCCSGWGEAGHNSCPAN